MGVVDALLPPYINERKGEKNERIKIRSEEA